MANEALGQLNLSPFTPCKNEKEARTLLTKCRDIAAQSLRYNGSSFGSGYFLLNGDEGGYLKYCQYYKKSEIPRHIFNGRPVFTKFKPTGK